MKNLTEKYANLKIDQNEDSKEIKVSWNGSLLLQTKIENLNEEILEKANKLISKINDLDSFLNKYLMFEIALRIEDEVYVDVINVWNEKIYSFQDIDQDSLQGIVDDYLEEQKQNIIKAFNESLTLIEEEEKAKVLSQKDSLSEKDFEAKMKQADMTSAKTKSLTVFTQNKKMKDSATDHVAIYNFGIPAFLSKTGLKTCPNATSCVSGCYARQGTYIWKTVNAAYEKRLKVAEHSLFMDIIKNEISKIVEKNSDKLVMIRVHDSGDFYDEEYQKMWYQVAADMSQEYSPSQLIFYAYTKMISQSNKLKEFQPENFDLIYSFGGREDDLINKESDRHSAVFKTEEELIKAGYTNASDDDKLALSQNHKVGLVYHGAKGFDKTGWKKK